MTAAGHSRAGRDCPNGRCRPQSNVRKVRVHWKASHAQYHIGRTVWQRSECCNACIGKICRRCLYRSISKDLCVRTDRRQHKKNFECPAGAERPVWQACKTSCFPTTHQWAALILRRGHDNQEVLGFQPVRRWGSTGTLVLFAKSRRERLVWWFSGGCLCGSQRDYYFRTPERL